jgi:hypothetical protein
LSAGTTHPLRHCQALASRLPWRDGQRVSSVRFNGLGLAGLALESEQCQIATQCYCEVMRLDPEIVAKHLDLHRREVDRLKSEAEQEHDEDAKSLLEEASHYLEKARQQLVSGKIDKAYTGCLYVHSYLAVAADGSGPLPSLATIAGADGLDLSVLPESGVKTVAGLYLGPLLTAGRSTFWVPTLT